MTSSARTYDKRPSIAAGSGADCAVGWADIAARIRGDRARVIAIETYPGVRTDDLHALAHELHCDELIDVSRALFPADEISHITYESVGDDPVFGHMSARRLESLIDAVTLSELRAQVERAQGSVVVFGIGASLVAPEAPVVYCDLPRWEATQRLRSGGANLGLDNGDDHYGAKYKRAYFVDWRVADLHKRSLWPRMKWIVDTTDSTTPKLVTAESVFAALHTAATRPFRVVPYFDPAPWGGEWMQDVCDVGREQPNLGWCFDCVPEENSLLLRYGSVDVEIPSIDLVFREPRALLGETVHGMFGAEFPIRTDFLDTIGGGNLSLQVHPQIDYMREHFGMQYTQDESYYILDARDGAAVHLGVRDDVDRDAMVDDLVRAQHEGIRFPHERHINILPARKHDHFLIPAGTLHGSAAGTMVLEISATPYIFTFKVYDWNRPGLDGRPRPIHLDHGLANLAWERNTARYAQERLVNRVWEVGTGDGWVEERTGLHEAEFIETRRHWFTAAVPHHDSGRFSVLNLVEGDSAIVESPDAQFEPFVVNYAETFIVPAAAGAFTVRPGRPGARCATIKAYVRCSP